MTDPVPSKERIGQLVDYWHAKSKSHERWPEGHGLHAEALGRIYADTISALKEIISIREDCRRWENAHKILLAQLDQHNALVNTLKGYIDRTALAGYRCAECAERLAPRPAHEREMPHCSTCSCPPYEPKSEHGGRIMTLAECVEAEGGIPFVGMEANTDPLTHQEIFSAVHHHASEIVRLTAAVPAQCSTKPTGEECPDNNCGLPGCPACFPPRDGQ